MKWTKDTDNEVLRLKIGSYELILDNNIYDDYKLYIEDDVFELETMYFKEAESIAFELFEYWLKMEIEKNQAALLELQKMKGNK